MDFDIVIGNPPYNNDMYLDFVQAGYEALKPDGVMVMITPAKWQAKGGKKNELFREQLVPHMKEIAYYKNEKEIFDVSCGAVCYYSVYRGMEYPDKNVTCMREGNARLQYSGSIKFGSICCIDMSDTEKNIMGKIERLGEASIANSSIKPDIFWNTTISLGRDRKRDIFDSSSIYRLHDTKNDLGIQSRYVKDVSKCQMFTLVGGHWCGNVPRLKIFEPYQIAQGENIVLYGDIDKQKVEYAKSYFECRLIWWLVYKFFGDFTMCNYSLGLVPDPGAFDHPFKDRELYEKYGLTDDEIAIIESVIKERK